MPTVLHVRGFRFYFYPGDCPEPIHIHVTRGSGFAKIWITTHTIASSRGFRPYEERRILEIVAANEAYLIMRWQEVCGGQGE